MKRKLSLLLLLLITTLVNAQQDPQYSLYQFNQMVINPAYAGARNAIAIVANVRSQWAGIDGAPRTNCLSLHAPIANKKVGVGITLVNDALGPRTSNGVYANAAYILKLNNRWKLSAGIGAGMLQYRFDYNKLAFRAQEINTQLYERQSFTVVDLTAGFYLRTDKFFMGLSTTHLSSPSLYKYNNTINSVSSTSIYKLQPHTFFTMGKSFMLSEKVVFAPSFVIRIVNSGNADLNLNFFLFKKLWLGTFIRSRYGAGALLQYYVTNNFRVGYSYDTGAGDARRLGPSHEVMLGFDFNTNKSKIVSPRFL